MSTDGGTAGGFANNSSFSGFDGGGNIQPMQSASGAMPRSFVPNMPYNPTFSPTGNTPTLGGQFTPTGFPAPPPTFSTFVQGTGGSPTGVAAPTSGIPGFGGSPTGPYMGGLFSPFGKY